MRQAETVKGGEKNPFTPFQKTHSRSSIWKFYLISSMRDSDEKYDIYTI